MGEDGTGEDWREERGERIGAGRKDNGDGFFFVVLIKVTAGFRVPGRSGTGGPAPLPLPMALPFPRITPPPNLDSACAIDGNSILDPKVGVPHLELAASTISCSPAPIAIEFSLPIRPVLAEDFASKKAEPDPARALR